MNHVHALYHMVRADFLERVRRYSFLLTLAFAVYLGWGSATGLIVVRLGEYRGIYNSAWVGSMMTLVGGLFISLVGFYIVKNAILRDEQTRVGRILASTPMSKVFYTVAKTLSNCAVLMTMVAVLAVAAILIQVFRGEDTHVQLGTLLAPFLWCALPAMAVTAAIAVLFETLPVLRGAVGNVIFFFLWVASLATAEQSKRDDFAGFFVIAHSMQDSLRKIFPAYNNSFSLNVGDSNQITRRFVWNGVEWTGAIILHRLWWMLIALGIACVAALFFQRFDPARTWAIRRKEKAVAKDSTVVQISATPAIAAHAAVHLTALLAGTQKNRFIQLVASELRMMLKGMPWWWYVAALGMLIAEAVSPTPIARQGVLIAAWIWPVTVWSQMGARESRFMTQSLIFSSAHALQKQLPAVWCAGVVVSMLTGGGYALRVLLSGDVRELLAWMAAALFIPSLALALGAFSGTSKPFEAIYTVIWYIGPLNRAPGFDFIRLAESPPWTAYYFVLSIALLATAYFSRRARMAYV